MAKLPIPKQNTHLFLHWVQNSLQSTWKSITHYIHLVYCRNIFLFVLLCSQAHKVQDIYAGCTISTICHPICINYTIPVINRANFAGLPIVREMLKTCRTLYSSLYYGYINSDILLSPSIFSVLDFLLEFYNKHQLSEGVSLNTIHHV